MTQTQKYTTQSDSLPYTEETLPKARKALEYVQGKNEAIAATLAIAYMDGIEAGQRLAEMQKR